MKLTDLSKNQWDAALAAARCVSECDPNVASDRQRFRDARQRLVALLPAGTNDRDIISAAVRWDSLNEFALAFAGLPEGAVERAGR